MECNRCGEIYFESQGYCNWCIEFGKYTNKEEPDRTEILIKDVKINMGYKLTKLQQEISDELIATQDDTIINAVCGAGKTEIIIAKIKQCLQRGRRVGIAIPRKEVVKEIGHRIREIFTNHSVGIVYGGVKDKSIKDIMIFTTHQSYNYTNCFSLLVIDEVDAFPYAGNILLENITNKTCNGQVIEMSATSAMKDNMPEQTLILDQRFHGVKMPVPEILKTSNMKEALLILMLKQTRPLICFFPTIALSNEYAKHFGDNFAIEEINSKLKTNDKVLTNFRLGKTKVIFSTLTLERGITLAGLDVFVIAANHELYHRKNLIQIAGRVGRKLEDTGGSVIFIDGKKSVKLRNVIKEIETKNMSIVQD